MSASTIKLGIFTSNSLPPEQGVVGQQWHTAQHYPLTLICNQALHYLAFATRIQAKPLLYHEQPPEYLAAGRSKLTRC